MNNSGEIPISSDVPVLLKVAAIWLGIYCLVLVFSFVSEITYNQRSIYDVRQDWRRITIRTSLAFAVLTVASVAWALLGRQGK